MKYAKIKLLCAAMISTAILCSACGKQTVPKTDSTQADEITEAGSAELPADNTGESEYTSTADDENAPSKDSDAGNVAASDVVSIETETFEDAETAENGTLIYERSYNIPTVTIAGNEEAGEMINSDLHSRVDAFTASEQMRNDALEFYEVSSKEDFSFHEYTESQFFSAVRSDTNVISFVISADSYTGGAHGFYAESGINYDAKTGKLINFEELSEDPDKFYNETLAYNRELAQTDEYKERMFEEGFLGEDEFENVLYGDEKWYLSDEGLVFISNPYELGPYAAGIINFVIPYDKLSEMGLKEEYSLPN